MKHIPILFSTPMVQALLDGRKTQTRRIIKAKHLPVEVNPNEYIMNISLSPYGQPGDVLWVKETYYAYGWWVKNGKTKTGKQKWKFIDFTVEDKDGKYHYEDSKPSTIENSRTEQKIGWYKRTSLFMPMEACRLFLKVKSVRVERLQDICEEDARAEGVAHVIDKITGYCGYDYLSGGYNLMTTPYQGFMSLWKKINGTESWQANPWVWVVEFERTEKPANWPS